MDAIANVINTVDAWIWGVPMIVLLLGSHIFLTIRTGVIQRKLFPGYVLVHMAMNNDLWYIVRNTRGCTGFVGPQSKPVPLSEEEAEAMLGAGVTRVVNADFEVGARVALLSGSFENFTGTIAAIDEVNQKLTVIVSLFGRDTPVEVDYDNARKVMDGEEK